jgi:hypothetical protein
VAILTQPTAFGPRSMRRYGSFANKGGGGTVVIAASLITRGYGTSPRLITRGFFSAVVTTEPVRVTLGAGGGRRVTLGTGGGRRVTIGTRGGR